MDTTPLNISHIAATRSPTLTGFGSVSVIDVSG
jgi:hypothetical protein